MLRVALDFSLHMNQLMCPNGAMAVVHVEEVSQPQIASWPFHPTMTITQTM